MAVVFAGPLLGRTDEVATVEAFLEAPGNGTRALVLEGGKTPADEWLTVDGQLAAELRDRLAAAGYDGELAAAFERWAGTENLENRLNGIERIDPVVLAHLRART